MTQKHKSLVAAAAVLAVVVPDLVFSLSNAYLPGSAAPPQAWFPLRTADFSPARALADSLLGAYIRSGKAEKNEAQNRLDGDTWIDKRLAESVCGNRVGEAGVVFLEGKKLGEVALAGFHVNWCDFYGALLETEYIPSKKFDLKKYMSGALLAMGPKSKTVRPCVFSRLPGMDKKIAFYYRSMDPQPFEYIQDMSVDAYEYVRKKQVCAIVNFTTGTGFSPGIVCLLEESADTFMLKAQYFIGEKAALVQAVCEEGEKDPVIEVHTSGSGTEYIVLQYNGEEFKEIYKRKENEFP
ncbi:MAG: hypothetical protein A2268_14240 [Candidatus Raymondbacteria bacterium RifOxyA12_full_50_37]|uniref:Uncharacterized protein n=1 Tax=Candidatus Raymondbacteria bacterium RIFOXYD12_FULL_49_13 TaxID=1817890 RepID=A0A1F7FKN0_UNCRA|nr:MAG: hypothetical protein A2268_14240 [Candidatus Raymondbacteria bacterium RifOxyA12_full_50_37]OGJ86919.1 MAG: hypothetical protein A2350_02150 [Candidatus Raymondbacteria bacterium RifOxyB12_full_50_8]OGJ88239.1 MAG: hypothetical protein A2248_19580 [Candidatus Raymondbacteria bacterium RIFOXYA2_FULL_49_16]OGJ97106.1 MAG: hypothetical protein A2487_05890 [Candidatus Raymondbacteria bacterium RifOxyC12_full_50_8]OGK07284.1 MAG: hypothetical protein A2519_14250 [Candidatus Raymondbacteria b